MGIEAERSQREPKQPGKGQEGSRFSAVASKSVISLMKWPRPKGKIAMDGNVIKLGFVIPK